MVQYILVHLEEKVGQCASDTKSKYSASYASVNNFSVLLTVTTRNDIEAYI